MLINKKIIIQQSFTLNKTEKLKSRKVIQQLFKEGKSFSNFPLRVIYLQPENNHSNLQGAFSVGSKNFKRAVDRNRIKRLMREAYRLQKTPLQNKLKEDEKYLVVFIIYTGKELPQFELIFKKMEAIIKTFEKKLVI